MKEALSDLEDVTDVLKASHQKKDKDIKEIFLVLGRLDYNLQALRKPRDQQLKLDLSKYLKDNQFMIIFSYLSLKDLSKVRLLSKNLNLLVKQHLSVLKEKNQQAITIPDQSIKQLDEEKQKKLTPEGLNTQEKSHAQESTSLKE